MFNFFITLNDRESHFYYDFEIVKIWFAEIWYTILGFESQKEKNDAEKTVLRYYRPT